MNESWNMPLKNINGININYTLDGSVNYPVITFVHGLTFNLLSWSKQKPAFKNNFQILCIDLRGHGLSELGKLKSNLRMKDFGSDILRLWDVLNIEKSHGGMVGFELALENVDRLASLTLIATQGKMPDKSRDRTRGCIENYKTSSRNMGLAAEQLMDRYLPNNFQIRDPEGFELLEKSIRSMSLDNYAFSSEAINSMDYDRCLSSIDIPTMVIAGELDIPTPPSRMQLYRDEITNAEWKVIKGAAHLPNFEKPNAFNACLLNFLQNVKV
jgi:pimeloyl-ACP methyl ester carboxylesterase